MGTPDHLLGRDPAQCVSYLRRGDRLILATMQQEFRIAPSRAIRELCRMADMAESHAELCRKQGIDGSNFLAIASIRRQAARMIEESFGV